MIAVQLFRAIDAPSGLSWRALLRLKPVSDWTGVLWNLLSVAAMVVWTWWLAAGIRAELKAPARR